MLNFLVRKFLLLWKSLKEVVLRNTYKRKENLTKKLPLVFYNKFWKEFLFFIRRIFFIKISKPAIFL